MTIDSGLLCFGYPVYMYVLQFTVLC